MTAPTNFAMVDHLRELRKRVMWSLGAVLVGAIVVSIFFEPIFSVLEAPYCDWAESEGIECSFLIPDVLSQFSLTLSIAGYGGVILALPVILYQFGRFVMPALKRDEKRTLIPFVLAGVLLFAGGAAGAYFLMPQAVKVLLEFNRLDSFSPNLLAPSYVSFFIKMILAFGFAAELPLVLVFLQKLGIVSPATLRKNRRAAIAVIFVLGAVITPTGDPFTLLAIAVPMYILFEASIIIGARLAPKA